jgi:hypothetical protein
MTFAFAQHAQHPWQASLRVANATRGGLRGRDMGVDFGAERFNQRAAFATQCEVLSRLINQNFAHPACKS